MGERSQVPHFTHRDLSALGIGYLDIVARIEDLIATQSRGQLWSAAKATFETPDGRYAMSTMAAAGDPPYLIVKSLLLNPANPAAGYPLMNALVTVQDARSGMPLATMDGNWVTALRTPALSLTAAKRLAKPAAATIAVIGCGLQARHHLAAFAELFPLKRVVACGRGSANIATLCRLADDMGLTATIAGSAQEAMADADIVISSVTRDPAIAPFIDAAGVAPGAFAALTDLGAQWHQDSLENFATIIVDDLAQEQAVTTRLVSLELVAGDLAGLVLGNVSGRRSASMRTAFIFRGHALGDFALASLAYEWAGELIARAERK